MPIADVLTFFEDVDFIVRLDDFAMGMRDTVVG